jgi:hypothetical protein
MIIIIVLKLDSRVKLGQGLGHGSGGPVRVDLDQCKDKNCYYHNFKTRLRGQPGQGPRYRLGGLSWVDPSRCMNKNNYYHSFKTWLGSRHKTRFRSWAGRVNPADPKYVNLITIHIKSKIDFFIFYYVLSTTTKQDEEILILSCTSLLNTILF